MDLIDDVTTPNTSILPACMDQVQNKNYIFIYDYRNFYNSSFQFFISMLIRI